jgi:hypothetical protein
MAQAIIDIKLFQVGDEVRFDMSTPRDLSIDEAVTLRDILGKFIKLAKEWEEMVDDLKQKQGGENGDDPN